MTQWLKSSFQQFKNCSVTPSNILHNSYLTNVWNGHLEFRNPTMCQTSVKYFHKQMTRAVFSQVANCKSHVKEDLYAPRCKAKSLWTLQGALGSKPPKPLSCGINCIPVSLHKWPLPLCSGHENYLFCLFVCFPIPIWKQLKTKKLRRDPPQGRSQSQNYSCTLLNGLHLCPLTTPTQNTITYTHTEHNYTARGCLHSTSIWISFLAFHWNFSFLFKKVPSESAKRGVRMWRDLGGN